MFAYVRYKDKHRALVPITLIKQFKPTDVDDFDPEKVKMVFWKKKDGTLAGHYKANVLMLGGKFPLVSFSRVLATGLLHQLESHLSLYFVCLTVSTNGN